MNIYFVTDYSIIIGGKERQMLEMLRFLNNRHIQFTVICLASQGLLYQEYCRLFSNQLRLIERNKIGYIKTILSLRLLFKNYSSPRIIHAYDTLAVYLVYIASIFIPIKLINGSIRHAGVERKFSYMWEKIALLLADIVVSNSLAGLKHYNLYGKGKVIYNFIDLERFIGHSDNPKTVIMTANFSEYKDHKTFIRTCMHLFDEGKLDRVGLIGSGKELDFWQKTISRTIYKDKFISYGHIGNVEEILSQYAIGVLCSTRKFKEGISNSILEYMGSGLIAIGTKIGATEEIIIDGYNGFLFEAEQEHSLFDKLSFVIEQYSKLDSIRRNAMNTLKEKFSAEKNCRQLLEIYENI